MQWPRAYRTISSVSCADPWLPPGGGLHDPPPSGLEQPARFVRRTPDYARLASVFELVGRADEMCGDVTSTVVQVLEAACEDAVAAAAGRRSARAGRAGRECARRQLVLLFPEMQRHRGAETRYKLLRLASNGEADAAG